MSSSKKTKKGRSEKKEELNPEKNRFPVDMYCFSPIFINRITEVIQVFITGVPVATRLHGEMEVIIFAREHTPSPLSPLSPLSCPATSYLLDLTPEAWGILHISERMVPATQIHFKVKFRIL